MKVRQRGPVAVTKPPGQPSLVQYYVAAIFPVTCDVWRLTFVPHSSFDLLSAVLRIVREFHENIRPRHSQTQLQSGEMDNIDKLYF